MQTLRASKCGLSTTQLPSSILDVLDSLTKAGYEAYIVGGGVRDMMLGLNPKDFDAVTNATPAQVKEVFGRRCRIIGRRFELAHVYSGRELIEVATFRAPPKKAVTSASGMILRDNNWGTIEQDFARRDFSINTLYYQPRQAIVLDFCQTHDTQARPARPHGLPAPVWCGFTLCGTMSAHFLPPCVPLSRVDETLAQQGIALMGARSVCDWLALEPQGLAALQPRAARKASCG